MDTWLRCTITPGQFTGEYAVEGKLHNGGGFSLFACDSDLDCQQFPSGADTATALLRVKLLDKRGDLALIELPKQTLENGATVTVKSDQLVQKRARQEA